MTIAELAEKEPPYAKIPHALILAHPSPLIRLYGILHYLWWNHLTFEVSDLAEMAGDTPGHPVTDRTVYRWLDALSAAGWIAYNRKPGKRGLGERITLYTSPNGAAQTSDPDVRGSSQPLIVGSEVSQTSDPDVRGSSQPLIVGSEVSQTSDPTIRGARVLPRPNAAKNAPQISGFRSPDSDPESTTPLPPETPTPSAGGGGGDDLSTETAATRAPSRAAGQNTNTAEPDRPSPPPPPVAAAPAPPGVGSGRVISFAARVAEVSRQVPAELPGAQLLRDHGVMSGKAIRAFGVCSPEILEAEIALFRDAGLGIGAALRHWETTPPGTMTAKQKEALYAAHNPRRSDDPLAREQASIAATDAYLADVRRQREAPRPVRETVGEARARRAREAVEAPPDAAPDAQ
jgi:hypothetical protein